MQTAQIKLARTRVPAILASGRCAGQYSQSAIQSLYDCGQIAAMRKRKKDGATTHVYLKAHTGEIARRQRTPTVLQVLPATWQHNQQACEAYR